MTRRPASQNGQKTSNQRRMSPWRVAQEAGRGDDGGDSDQGL